MADSGLFVALLLERQLVYCLLLLLVQLVVGDYQIHLGLLKHLVSHSVNIINNNTMRFGQQLS